MTMTDLDRAAAASLVWFAESTLRTGALVLIAGAVLALWRPRASALNLLVWTAVLGAAIAMPAIDRLLPAIAVPVPAAMPVPPLAATLAPLTTVSPVIYSSAVRFRSGDAAAPIVPRAMPATPAPTESLQRGVAITPAAALFGVYLIGVVVLMFRGAVGWLTAARLERSARSISDARLIQRAGELAVAANLRRMPRVVESPRVHVPITTSVLQPTIVLPAHWRDWRAEALDAVLAHELSHVARRDPLLLRVSMSYRAICWPSPLGWWLHRRLSALAEQASDESALEAGVDRATYAETLVGFFADVRRGHGHRAAWHLAMAPRGSRTAERRVERVLAWTRPARPPVGRRAAVALALASIPAIVLAASVQASARQSRPSAPDLGSLALSGSIDLTSATRSVLLANPIPRQIGAAVSAAVESSTAPRPASAPEPAPTPNPAASPTPSQTPLPTPSTIVDADRGPLTSAQVSGHRVWILVFDLASMTGADLAKAVDGSTKWVNEKMASDDLVAVASLGSSLQIVQDFTNDRDKVRSKLQQVLTSGTLLATATDTPTTGASALELNAFNNDMRLRALKTICDSVLPIQQHKAILYFSKGMTPSALNEVEGRAAENACSRANVSIDPVDARGLQVVIAGGSARAGSVGGVSVPMAPTPTLAQTQPQVQPISSPVAGISLSFIPHQTDSPVTLLSTTSDEINGAFATVAVRNDTKQIVRSVTLAGFAITHDRYLRTNRWVYSGLAMVTWIPPGETRTLEPHVIDMSKLQSLDQGTEITLDVIGIDFSDGTNWKPDPAIHREFDSLYAPSTPAGSTTIYRPGNGIKSPVPISKRDPQYPDAARNAKIQGDVALEAVVLADGTVGDVRVTKSLDTQFGLDQEAMKAAKAWRFAPATLKDGQPVAMIVGIIVEFRLGSQPPPRDASDAVWSHAYREGAPGLVMPAVRYRSDPKYTADAMRAKVQGTVGLEVLVNADGKVVDARVTSSLDTQFGLDLEAVKAVKNWTYRPATLNGQPVYAVVDVTTEFRIH